MAVFTVGVWPWHVRPGAQRDAHTAAAALVAIPVVGRSIGELLHDLSIAFPGLEHDRWCSPQSDRLLTTGTAPDFLFLPLFAWASLLWLYNRTER